MDTYGPINRWPSIVCVMHTPPPLQKVHPVHKRRHFYVITPDDTFMVEAMDVGEAAAAAQSNMTVQASFIHVIDTEYGKEVLRK
jgi:hypothetical protein